MPSCAVPGCDSNAPKCNDEKVRSFSLPNSAETRKKWLEQLNRQGIGKKDFKPTKNTRICIRHFTANDFVKSNKDKRGRLKKLSTLKQYAVPTQFMKNDAPKLTTNAVRRSEEHNHDHNYFNRRVDPPPGPQNVDDYDETLAQNMQVDNLGNEYSVIEEDVDLNIQESIDIGNAEDPKKEQPLEEIIAKQNEELERLRKLEAGIQGIFNPDQIAKIIDPKKKVHWSSKTIQDGIKIMTMTGGKTYQALRGDDCKLPLPSKSTIEYHIRDIKCLPGLDGMDDFFKLMREKVQNFTDSKQRDCCLMFDEVAIQAKKEYNTSTQSIVGYPTIPQSESTQAKNVEMKEHVYAKGVIKEETLATHALGFMISNTWGKR